MLLMMFHYICKHTQSLQGQKQVSKQITGRKRLPEPNGSVHVNEKVRERDREIEIEKKREKKLRQREGGERNEEKCISIER